MHLQGIASDLLRLVERRARELSCRAIYLHVLAGYNAPATSFYQRHGFWEASLLKGFYNLRYHRKAEHIDRQLCQIQTPSGHAFRKPVSPNCQVC